MKLNKKGYMLVEIIVSFTIAFAMLYFLMQIIINMKNINEDYYLETKLEADQLAMTKVVMDDILSNELESIDASKKDIIDFKFKNGLKTRITILKKDNKTLFQYGPYDSNGYIMDDLYTKEIDKNLKLYDTKLDNKCLVDDKYIECQDNTKADKAILNIILPGYTTYSNINYGISLDIPYKYGELEIISTINTLMVRNKSDYVLGNNNIKSEEVEEIEFLPSINVPSNIPSANIWDISEKQNKSILSWYTDVDNDGLYEIHIGQNNGVVANSNSRFLFASYKNLTKLSGLENLDMSLVLYGQYMFRDCKNLKTLDLSVFKGSKLENMVGMFSGMESIESFDGINNLDTSNVTNMAGMFSACRKIKKLNLSSFETSKVTGMGSMFSSMNELEELDVSSFDTSNVENMRSMFSYDYNLKSLNLKSFNTSKVTNMSGMFHCMTKLEELDLSSFNTSNVVDMGDGTKYITDSGFSGVVYGMFSSCVSLKKITFGSNFNTSKVRNMRRMFDGDRSLIELDVSKFDTSNVVDMSYMFNGVSKVKNIDISKFNTKMVRSMEAMFSGMSALTSLTFGDEFDTSLVDDMSGMFAGCLVLKNLDLSNFNTKNVTDMGTENLKFYYNNNASTWNYSYFNAGGMFMNCRDLETIKFGDNFDTSGVTNMSGMFTDMKKIQLLDISKFDTSKVEDMTGMFFGMENINKIYVSDKWSINKVGNSDYMFLYSTKLPNYNESIIDKTNAHYNSGGYLTHKAA